DVQLGVFWIAAAVTRQLHFGHRLAGQFLVEQQRQDRVKKRRGRQLDLTAFGQLSVKRNNFAQDLQVLVEQPILVVLREVTPFLEQCPQAFVALAGKRVDPGKVEPDLQVAKIPLREAAQRLAGG